MRNDKLNLNGFYKFLDVRNMEKCDFNAIWEKTRFDKEIRIPMGKKKYINLSSASGCNIMINAVSHIGQDSVMETLVLAIATLYSPKKVSFYVIDSDQSMFRLNFLKLPHIMKYSPFIHYNDEEKNKMMDFIKKEIINRKSIFEDIGVSDYDGYINFCSKFDIDNVLPRIIFVLECISVFDNGDVFYKDLDVFKEFKEIGFNMISTNYRWNIKNLFVRKYDITDCVSYKTKNTRRKIKCQVEGVNHNFNCKIPIIESTISAAEHTELKQYIEKMIKTNDLMA